MFGASTPFSGGGGAGAGGFGQPTNTAPQGFGTPAAAPSGGLFNTPFSGGAGAAPPAAGGGLFGAAAPTNASPFGGGGGGGSTFGAPAPAAGFGGASTFGAAPATGGAFGATGFGGQQPQQQQQQPGAFGSVPAAPFGGGGGFGQPQQQQQQTNTGFGSSTTTGGGGLFGSTNTTTTAFAPAPGLFGSTQPQAPSATPFGGGSTFGAPAPAPNTFGASPPAPGLFGAPAPSTTGFGAAPTFGGSPAPAPAVFGAPPPATGGGLFGSTGAPATGLFGQPQAPGAAGAQQGGGGTRIAPYQPTTKQDGSTNINLQAITAMPAYENKSFEELRFEDYSQGNRGTAAGTPTAANTAGGFGFNQPAPAAPAAPGGLFGAPPPAPGATPAGGNLFGGTFGNTAAPAPTPGLFGTQTPAAAAPVFGAAPAPFGAPAATPSLFSSQPQPAAPAPGGGLFGSAAPTPTFGAPTTPGFGAAPAPAFAQQPQQPAPAPLQFGQAPGAPAPSLFGQPAPAPQFGFGSTHLTTPTPGFAAQPAQAPLGYQQQQTQPVAQQSIPVPIIPTNTQIIPPAANEIMEQQMRAMEKQREEMEKTQVWSGRTARSSPSTPVSQPGSDSILLPSRTYFAPYVATSTPPSSAKLRPRGFPKTESTAQKTSTSTSGRRDNTWFSPESQIRSSVMRLVIKPDSVTKPRLKLDVGSANDAAAAPPASSGTTETITSPPPDDVAAAAKNNSNPTPSPRETPGQPKPTAPTGTEPSSNPSYDYYQRVISGSTAGSKESTDPAPAATPTSNSYLVPKLTNPGYKVTPSLEALSSMSEADLAAVEGFSVRHRLGVIEWEGAVDVRGADLDRIVCIKRMDVSVYLKDEEDGIKPAEGSKLNRPAVLTFFDVFSSNGGRDASDEVKEEFAVKVKTQTEKMDTAEFISYDRDAGEWKIRVDHFSRYALDDTDDDDAGTGAVAGKEQGVRFEEPRGMTPRAPKSILRNRRATPFPPKTSRITLDQDMDSSPFEMTEADIVNAVQESADRAAEDVFATIQDATTWNKVEKTDKVETTTFEEEGVPEVGILELAKPPSESDIRKASSERAVRFTERLAKKSKIRSQSSPVDTLFSRSFRVGWSKDGSFLQLSKSNGGGPSLVRSRPVFSLSQDSAEHSTEMLKIHMDHSRKIVPEDHQSGKQPCLYELNKKVTADDSAGASSWEPLRSALIEFSNVDTQTDEEQYAFLLLASILESQSQGGTDESKEVRVLAAVANWLSAICSSGVQSETKLAMNRGDPHTAIFAALSGGDVELACDVAMDAGLSDLSLALSTGIEGRNELLCAQLQRLSNEGETSMINPKAVSALSGISGAFEKGLGSDDSLDWVRQLILRVIPEHQESLSALYDRFQSDIESGKVPFPYPQYGRPNNEVNRKSILYQLFQLLAHPKTVLTQVVDPRGYTPCPHDFVTPFLLASSITAMGTSTCTTYDGVYLLEGISAHLVSQGMWELAVYTNLCCMGGRCSVENTHYKVQRAKNLVLRHYDADEPRAPVIRSFLETQVGVPSQWFSEAQSQRCFAAGRVLTYVMNELDYNPSGVAAQILEQLWLPSVFFMDRDEVQQLMSAIELMGEPDSLSLAMTQLFRLDEQMRSLVGEQDRETALAALPQLLSTHRSIEDTLRAYCSSVGPGQGGVGASAASSSSSLQMVPNFRSKQVPLSSMVVEALQYTKYMKMELEAVVATLTES